jgi:hypothetical protein
MIQTLFKFFLKGKDLDAAVPDAAPDPGDVHLGIFPIFIIVILAIVVIIILAALLRRRR